jgi:hypothetical protein
MHAIALMLTMFCAYLIFKLLMKKDELKKKDIEIRYLREEHNRYREEQLSMYHTAYKNFLSSYKI